MPRYVQHQQDEWLHSAQQHEPLTEAQRGVLAKVIKEKGRNSRRRLRALENLIELAETEALDKLDDPGLTWADAEAIRRWQPPTLTSPGPSPHTEVRRRAALASVESRRRKYGTSQPLGRPMLAEHSEHLLAEHADHVLEGEPEHKRG